MFSCFGNPIALLKCFNTLRLKMLLRITFNFESLCVSSLAKTLPGNSYWHRRFQSTTLWDVSISHLQAKFCLLLLETCISDAILCITTRSQGEILQSSTAFAGLFTTALDHHIHPFHGQKKKNILYVVLGKEGKAFSILLFPILLSDFRLKELSLLKEPKSLWLEMRFSWDTHQTCQNAVVTVVCSRSLTALPGWKYSWLRCSWSLFLLQRHNLVPATKWWV